MATQLIQLQDPPNDAMLDALVDALDVSTAGDIQILNDQSEVLVTIPLSFPAFNAAAAEPGPPSGSRATWRGGDQQGTAATQTNQIATAFNARTSAAALVFDGTVGGTGSGEAMQFSNTTMNNNDTVRILEAGSSMFMPDAFP